MVCGICKTNNPEEAQFCSNCGHTLDGNTFSGTPETAVELPTIGFGEAIGLAFSKYFKFSGRATRAEYWWFYLFLFLVNFLGLIPLIGQSLSSIIGLICIIPHLSLVVRRLHDIGKTGWWALVWLLIGGGVAVFAITAAIFAEETGMGEGVVKFAVLVGSVVLVASVVLGVWWLVWFIRKGDLGPNKYGPDPQQGVLP